MMRDVKKIFRSILVALNGLRHAYRADKSFRMEINYGIPVYALLAWSLAPLGHWEIVFLAFSYLLILIVELVNTAFETMIDHLHPNEHEVVGQSKDIASAAVFLAFCFAILVIGSLICSRLVHGVDTGLEYFFV